MLKNSKNKPIFIQVESLKKIENSGFSLMEVLLTTVIVAIGIYAILRLHLVSTSGNQSATNRVKAVWYLNDIAERIRNNPAGGVQGFYVYNSASFSPGSMCNTAATSCTPAEIAAYDLNYWNAMLKGSTTAGMHMHDSLPEVEATITNDGNGTYTTSIKWSDLYLGFNAGIETHEVTETIRFFTDDQIQAYTP